MAETRELAPRTLVAVQVAYASDVGRAVQVGAAAAFPRTTSPADLAEALRACSPPPESRPGSPRAWEHGG